MVTVNTYLKNQFLEEKVFPQDLVEEALIYSQENKCIYFEGLVAQKGIDEDKVYETLGKIMDIPFARVDLKELNEDVLTKCSVSYILENRLVPLEIKEDTVIVLTDNPLNSIDGLRMEDYYALPATLKIVSKTNLENLLSAISNKFRRAEVLSTEDAKEEQTDNELVIDDYLDAPAVALASTLLEEAVAAGASDIHIEPQENDVRVRFRVDGILEEHCILTKKIYSAVLSRYKIISGLDIAERRIPQDGKINLKIKGVEYDFRISTLPIVFGEKIVIRIFDKFGANATIDSITHDEHDRALIKDLIQTPNGIILMTGPTGSGKTTTLYTFLRELNKPGVNIQTVEDPVENMIPGINQLQTNSSTGLTFASALRSILRQDPNIIMVGEIRDEETAHIAVQAAITGHLVFSTVHTNDAITTITRLIDMNVEPYMVGDTLHGAISQRLVRKLCPYCKKEHKVNATESKILGIKEGEIIYEAGGCSHCNNTGYKGRTAVFEILVIGDNIRENISKRKFDSYDMKEAARKDGLVPLNVKAADLVKEGITSLDEYFKIISKMDNR